MEIVERLTEAHRAQTIKGMRLSPRELEQVFKLEQIFKLESDERNKSAN
jgi:hypothetical protein